MTHSDRAKEILPKHSAHYPILRNEKTGHTLKAFWVEPLEESIALALQQERDGAIDECAKRAEWCIKECDSDTGNGNGFDIAQAIRSLKSSEKV